MLNPFHVILPYAHKCDCSWDGTVEFGLTVFRLFLARIRRSILASPHPPGDGTRAPSSAPASTGRSHPIAIPYHAYHQSVPIQLTPRRIGTWLNPMSSCEKCTTRDSRN